VKSKPAACEGCSLYHTGVGYVLGHGPKTAKLALVGEAPGADEAEAGLPFVGGAGHILDALLKQAGIPRKEVFIDNVLRCRPPGNKYPTGKTRTAAESQCRQYDAIGRSVHPVVVVPLGDKALKLYTKHSGITRWRGSILSK